LANKKTRNEQRKNSDKVPPARREAKSKGKSTFNEKGKLNDDTRVIHAEEPNRGDG